MSVSLSCNPYPAIHVLQSMSCDPCLYSCPVIRFLQSMFVSMSCNPCLAIRFQQSMSCNPCPATHVLPSMSCRPCPAIRILPFMSCHPCPAIHVLPFMSCQDATRLPHSCLPECYAVGPSCSFMLSSLLCMTNSLFTGWVGGFNLTLIEFPETFRGRHVEDTVEAVCVHAARNFRKIVFAFAIFKGPVCHEIFLLCDCTLPVVRN